MCMTCMLTHYKILCLTQRHVKKLFSVYYVRRWCTSFYAVEFCWEVKEITYVQEVYGQTYGEDNAYERTYTHAQSEVAYIDVDWRFRSHFRFRFRRTRYCRFWCRLCHTRYCPVRKNIHTQVVPPQKIYRLDRLYQTGVRTFKWTRKLTSIQ